MGWSCSILRIKSSSNSVFTLAWNINYCSLSNPFPQVKTPVFYLYFHEKCSDEQLSFHHFRSFFAKTHHATETGEGGIIHISLSNLCISSTLSAFNQEPLIFGTDSQDDSNTDQYSLNFFKSNAKRFLFYISSY